MHSTLSKEDLSLNEECQVGSLEQGEEGGMFVASQVWAKNFATFWDKNKPFLRGRRCLQDFKPKVLLLIAHAVQSETVCFSQN